MSHAWLVAFGIDVQRPQGAGERSVLGHRLVLALSSGPKSMRELHAATLRMVPGGELRGALEELAASGLAQGSVSASGPRGGRPREVWRLLYPGTSAVAVARVAVDAAKATSRLRRVRVCKGPKAVDRDVGANMARRQARARARPRKHVHGALADEVCAWIASGQYLRDFCRRAGRPAVRTIYGWMTRDPAFRARFQQARALGEMVIRDQYLELAKSPIAAAAFAGDRKARREFQREYVRPIELRLQRWGTSKPRKQMESGESACRTC